MAGQQGLSNVLVEETIAQRSLTQMGASGNKMVTTDHNVVA